MFTLCSSNDWNVSTVQTYGTPGVTLSVFRIPRADGVSEHDAVARMFRHPLHDGLVFANRDEARDYAHEHGLLFTFVSAQVECETPAQRAERRAAQKKYADAAELIRTVEIAGVVRSLMRTWYL